MAKSCLVLCSEAETLPPEVKNLKENVESGAVAFSVENCEADGDVELASWPK